MTSQDGTLLGIPVIASQHTVMLTCRPQALYLTLPSILDTIDMAKGLASLAIGRTMRRNARP
jgi:hypothetical protein